MTFTMQKPTTDLTELCQSVQKLIECNTSLRHRFTQEPRNLSGSFPTKNTALMGNEQIHARTITCSRQCLNILVMQRQSTG